MKLGPVLWPKVVQQLTGPEKWLKNVDLSAIGHAPHLIIVHIEQHEVGTQAVEHGLLEAPSHCTKRNGSSINSQCTNHRIAV